MMEPGSDIGGQAGGNGRAHGWLGSLQSTPDGMDSARHFVHSGKSIRDLLMRTNLRDRKDVNALVLMLHKVRLYKMGEPAELMIQDLLASLPSIGGRSRNQLLCAITGMIVPGLVGDNGKAPKEKRGWFNRKRDEDNDDD